VEDNHLEEGMGPVRSRAVVAGSIPSEAPAGNIHLEVVDFGMTSQYSGRPAAAVEGLSRLGDLLFCLASFLRGLYVCSGHDCFSSDRLSKISW
jgi:hypothetical protein